MLNFQVEVSQELSARDAQGVGIFSEIHVHMHTRQAELSQELSARDAQIARLQEQMAEKDEGLAVAEGKFTEAEGQAAALLASKQAAEALLAAAEKAKAELESSETADLSAKQAEIAALLTQVNTATTEAAQLKASNEELAAKLAGTLSFA